MSSKNNECRFCLKKMQINERMALIDDEIKDQFVGITQLMLESGSGLSQIICELCLRSLQLASAVKLQFIENQRKLHYFGDDSDDNDSNCSELPTVQPPEIISKKRRRDQRHDDYVDPLSLVTVQSNEHFEAPETIRPSTFKIKQEHAETFESSYNYEELPTMLNEQEDRKPKYNRSFNIPKTERKLNTVGEKSFQCPHCKNFYKRRPHMLRHIEVAHMKCKFICVVPDCEQFFVRKERLKKHLEVSHSDLAPQAMTAMIDKLRILKPVYGNEAPELLDDSQNAGDDSMNQDETKDENDAGTSNNFGTTSNGTNDMFDDRDSLFRGLELERRRIMELENVRGFMSDLREEGKSSLNQTM
ncbi:zinc finger protein kipf-like [Chironomus tepperi]|uniref:zinc finger protein kipf-like n=1 Tax=Chironomus tepperi TaxID=113505 RepID=UPI00391F8C1B